jgi:serine/threonine protein kinase/tetratricopeptide (TPR) repeat protein
MSATPNHEEILFEQALRLDSAEARAAYLREACGEDAALHERLLGLLRAHDRAGQFLEHKPPEPGVSSYPAGAAFGVPTSGGVAAGPAEAGTTSRLCEQPGDRIGRYKLLELIGEGGMGVVWMAEQEEPVRRRVALKIIKPGMDSGQVIARFEAERQALALMDHPNIAKVFDGGVSGAESRVGILPAPAASAANEPGIRTDDKAPAALGGQDACPTFARPYFVMELVQGISITKYCETVKMSTRQRLELFGQVCRAVQHAHQKGIIHRDLKPSNILVTEQDGRPIPKVIDFGIAKATEGRLTAKTLFTAFAQLIGTPTYMSPEQAGLGSLDVDTRSDTYSLGVVLYELLTGRPPFDTKELLKQGYEAVLRTIREVDPPRPSTRLKELRLVQPGAAVQSEIDPDLDWIVMKCLEKDRARRYDTANALAQDIERYLHDEPVLACPPSTLYRWQKFARKHRAGVTAAACVAALLVAASVVSTALALWANQERAKAERAQKSEAAHRQTAVVERNRATIAETQAKDNERKAKGSEAEARAVLEFFQDNVLAAARPKGQGSGLGKEATIREAVEAAETNLTKVFTDRPLAEASIRHTLAWTFFYLGDYVRSIEHSTRCLALREANLGPDEQDTLSAMNILGLAQHAVARHAEAISVLEKAVRRSEARFGSSDGRTLSRKSNLALAYASGGRLAEALPLHEAVLLQMKQSLGTNHDNTLVTMNTLALAYRDAGRTNDALQLFQATFNFMLAKYGPDHPHTLGVMYNIADVHWKAARTEEALPLFEENLKRRRETLGSHHPDTGDSLRRVGQCYVKLREYRKADQTIRPIIEDLRRSGHTNGRNMANALSILGQCLLADGQPAVAESLLREALLIFEKLEPGRSSTLMVQSLLSGSLLAQRKFADAEPLLLQSYEGLTRQAPPAPSTARVAALNETIQRLVQLYEAWGKPDEAAKWREKLRYPAKPAANTQP